jgi:hypothetical protein
LFRHYCAPPCVFYNLAFEKPDLAGRAFWYYFANRYKKENVTYFLYLSRVYRNTNTAALRICKKKFKEVLQDFMQEEEAIARRAAECVSDGWTKCQIEKLGPRFPAFGWKGRLQRPPERGGIGIDVERNSSLP